MKLKIIYKYLISLFFHFIYGKVFLTSFKIKRKKIVSSLFDKKNKYFFYELENVRIYTDKNENVSVIKNNKLINEVSYQQINNYLKNNKFNQVLKSGTPKFHKTFNGKILMLAQGASGYSNYCHWFLDIIPRIKLFTIVNKKNIDYIYLNKPNNFQRESLKVLGLNKIKFIDSKKFNHVFSKKLFICSHPNYKHGTIVNAHSKIPVWIIKYIKNTFVHLCRKKYKRKIKIFIDRSDSKYNHCKLINNRSIINYLKRRGFEIIKLSDLKLKEQIEKFFNAKIIIGPHGAGLANLIFCKKLTKVIEIRPANHPNKVYERISKINNLSYKLISLDYIKDNNEGDMELNLNLLSKYFS